MLNALVLYVEDSNNQPLVVPLRDEIIIGRTAPTTSALPDVDLEPFDGTERGVSRQHAAIRYRASDGTLNVIDLGSANRTYLDGKMLIPHRPYPLQHGAQLRFGLMTVHIYFRKERRQ
jgi:pSer/pThr/pTyr-binding forkhead associated (FHA) protein